MKKLINEIGYICWSTMVIAIVGFSVVWWIQEIGDFLIKN